MSYQLERLNLTAEFQDPATADLERTAYADGDTNTATLLGRIMELENRLATIDAEHEDALDAEREDALAFAADMIASERDALAQDYDELAKLAEGANWSPEEDRRDYFEDIRELMLLGAEARKLKQG